MRKDVRGHKAVRVDPYFVCDFFHFSHAETGGRYSVHARAVVERICQCCVGCPAKGEDEEAADAR